MRARACKRIERCRRRRRTAAWTVNRIVTGKNNVIVIVSKCLDERIQRAPRRFIRLQCHWY